MKKKITNNLGLKLLSLFLAFFLWLLVVNISNPIISGTEEVPVEIKNEGVLTAAGLTYEIVGKSTVTVNYRVHILDEYKISSSDFKAYIDLENLYDVTGAVPVEVEVVGHKTELSSSSVEITPGVIHVNTEELQRKSFAVQGKPVGIPKTGYDLGDLKITPEYVYVRGPVSQVGQISYVGIEFDVEGATADITGTASPQFYDANGNKIEELSRVTVDIEEITYEQSVLKVKSVPVIFNVGGTVASEYEYLGLETSAQSISVVGESSLLQSLTAINIPESELSIEGATGTKSLTIDVTKYLPEGVDVVGNNKNITVKLKVEPLVTRTLTLNLKGLPETGREDDYKYSLNSDSVEVTVKGLEEALNNLDADQLEAEISLAGMIPGENPGVLNIEDTDTYRVISYTPFTVTVTETVAPVSAGADNVAEKEETETYSSETTE
ncbi:MAG: CdaR family protein [Lachnoclostridium edouardi]|uniref:CdaR family protein n=1 Tax=Lachnoclostridium edouardi TaxID=1926283 RepID=UPI0026DD1315|nr:CdaR family protein [Lachnoclostridium edouardi]MDO4277332.1 CdaR family protein [Lachnoclostridium edouardi]